MKLNHDRNQANFIFFYVPETESNNFETSITEFMKTHIKLPLDIVKKARFCPGPPAISSLITSTVLFYYAAF